jgi:N-formylmaleamate deformylase
MPWQQHDLTVGGIRLHYERSGENKPALVLVHGLTDHSRAWLPVAKMFESEFDITMFDMRGHGHSDAPESGYSPADYAGDLLGLISALGLDRPAVIGHSLGAATAAAAAAIDSSAMRCVVLEDPPWAERSGAAEDLTKYAVEWRASIEALKKLDHAGRAAQCKAEHPNWSDTDCDLWAESKELVRLEVFSGFGELMAPWQSTAAKIACPALLVTGDPTLGAIVSPAVSAEFSELVADARVAQIPDAGHSIHREQLDEFVRVVRAFLHGI